MSNTQDSVSSAIQITSNFVKNTPLRITFSTLFSVFGYPNETLSLVFDISHEGISKWLGQHMKNAGLRLVINLMQPRKVAIYVFLVPSRYGKCMYGPLELLSKLVSQCLYAAFVNQCK